MQLVGKFFLTLLCLSAFWIQQASSAENPKDPITLSDFYYECSRAFRMELPEG